MSDLSRNCVPWPHLPSCRKGIKHQRRCGVKGRHGLASPWRMSLQPAALFHPWEAGLQARQAYYPSLRSPRVLGAPALSESELKMVLRAAGLVWFVSRSKSNSRQLRRGGNQTSPMRIGSRPCAPNSTTPAGRAASPPQLSRTAAICVLLSFLQYSSFSWPCLLDCWCCSEA